MGCGREPATGPDRATSRSAGLPDPDQSSPSAMHRQITDWFSAADVKPRRLDLCTGQMVIAHLVQEGVAAAFLPVKLMEPVLVSGSVIKLRSMPEFPHAAVCAGHRIGGATAEIEAVIAAAQRVLGRFRSCCRRWARRPDTPLPVFGLGHSSSPHRP